MLTLRTTLLTFAEYFSICSGYLILLFFANSITLLVLYHFIFAFSGVSIQRFISNQKLKLPTSSIVVVYYQMR